MKPLAFTTASLSDAGGRDHNEDACGARGHCWVVADGLGGHGGGEVAARLAVERVLDALANAAPEPEALAAAIDAAATAVRAAQQSEPRLERMRTTLVVLVSDGRAALWAHVGDSRLYHFRAGRVTFQTSDHSVPQTLVTAGQLAPSEIRGHEDRNRLLRTLGNDNPPRPTLAEAPLRLAAGDAFLLCTDGFWEEVTEPEMEVLLAKCASPADWLQAMAARLTERATPDQDNYTALAVYVG